MADRESKKSNHTLRDFGGVNTRSARTVIGTNEFAWLENVMPLGYGNMTVLPKQSGTLATWPTSVYRMKSANLGGTDYMVGFGTNGAGYAVSLSTYSVTTFAAAGTFSGAGTAMAQWENEQLVIVDPTKGYFSLSTSLVLTKWNGTLQDLQVKVLGKDFVRSPLLVFTGGGGTGAAGTADIQCGLAGLNTAGTGYAAGDILTVAGGTFTTAARIQVSSVSGAGAITGLNLYLPGDYTVAPSNPVSVTGGYGSGATFNLNFGVGPVTLVGIGSGYTSAPTVTVVDRSISAATPVAAGTGYAVGNVLTLTGGTFVTAATVTVATIDGSGGVTSVTVTTGGDYSVPPTNPVSVTGGAGSGATFNITMAPTSGASVTVSLTAVPTGGTSVATYAGRVWVAKGRTVVFSGPGSFSDFSLTASGGDVLLVDETLHSDVTAMLSANNFLYLFGTSSINVISDVQVVSGVTSFSNTNISASIGTTMPDSVSAYYRGVWFATGYGIHALHGTTAAKVSDNLDGIYALLDQALLLSSGQALLNRVMTQVYLMRYNDPVAGARPLLAVFSDKRWFFASQGADLIQIDSALVNGDPTLYGTNGTTLTKLFAESISSIAHTIKTKLWDMGEAILDKQSFKLGIELSTPVEPRNVTGTVDTEFDFNSVAFSLPGGRLVQWVNSNNQIVQWVNGSGATVQWATVGYSFQRTDAGTVGKYIGITVQSDAAQVVYSGFHLQFEARAAW